MSKTSILDAPSGLHHRNYMPYMMEVDTRIKCLSSGRAQTKSLTPGHAPTRYIGAQKGKKGGTSCTSHRSLFRVLPDF